MRITTKDMKKMIDYIQKHSPCSEKWLSTRTDDQIFYIYKLFLESPAHEGAENDEIEPLNP